MRLVPIKADQTEQARHVEHSAAMRSLECARHRLVAHLRANQKGGRVSEVMALICGPSGCGKTCIVEAAAREIDADVLLVDALYSGARLAQVLRTLGRGRIGRRQILVFDDVEHTLQSYSWFVEARVSTAVVGMSRFRPRTLRLSQPPALIIYLNKFDRAASAMILRIKNLPRLSDDALDASNGDARQLIVRAEFLKSADNGSRDPFEPPVMELRQLISGDSMPDDDEDRVEALRNMALRNVEAFCDLEAAGALLEAVALFDAGALDGYGLRFAIRHASARSKLWDRCGVLRMNDDHCGDIDTVAAPSTSTGTLLRRGFPFSSKVRRCI